MKKVLVALFAVIFCALSFCTSVSAAEEKGNEMTSVCVSVPDSWENPCCWAWADDGTNAFAAWPGEKFERLDDGWYYIYVPSYVQNIIVNATDGSVQTDGIIVEAGKNVWITVNEDKTVSLSYETQNKTEIPDYVEKFTIHVYVPIAWKSVNLWAWSAPDGTNAFKTWPGQEMEEGSDGWFTTKAPTWVNSIIISGNEGTVQTADISIEGKELWITVYEDLTYEISDTDPDKAVENVTVYAQVPSDWESPCCWAWSAPDGTNAFSSWPGEAFTTDGTWYTIEVPGWINSVIINANGGKVQTTDLSVEKGKDAWVVVTDAENATVSYTEPTVTVNNIAETGNNTAESDNSEKTGNIVPVICIVLAVVIVATVVTIVIMKKKKAK